MRKTLKKFISSILVLGMLAASFTVPTAAEATEQEVQVSEINLQENSEPVKLGAGITVYSRYTSSNLSGNALYIYNSVANSIKSGPQQSIKRSFQSYHFSSSSAASTAAAKVTRALNDTLFEYYSSAKDIKWEIWYYSVNGVRQYYFLKAYWYNTTLQKSYKRAVTNKNTIKSRTASVIKGASSTRTKYLRIRNYVCSKLAYNVDTLGTIDQALRGTKTKCTGYALLTQAMCRAAGITCRGVIGEAGSYTRRPNHMWNLVKIGSTWFWSDPTWFDTSGRNSTYSLKTKSSGIWSSHSAMYYLDTLSFKQFGFTSDMFD